MSATGRPGVRQSDDHYHTPEDCIANFLREVEKELPGFTQNEPILDPCAGGDAARPMPYPQGLVKVGFTQSVNTVDIRADSLAERKEDFLTATFDKKYELIISNPPFNLAQQFIEKSLKLLEPEGCLVFLLRLNFFGSQKRKQFWQDNMPEFCYVHSKRPTFVKGGSDSTEYAHFVWIKGHRPRYTQLRVI